MYETEQVVENAREETVLALKRLGRERMDYQAQFNESKSKLNDMFSCIDSQLLDIRYLKQWSYKLNELLSMQTAAEI